MVQQKSRNIDMKLGGDSQAHKPRFQELMYEIKLVLPSLPSFPILLSSHWHSLPLVSNHYLASNSTFKIGVPRTKEEACISLKRNFKSINFAEGNQMLTKQNYLVPSSSLRAARQSPQKHILIQSHLIQ